ncbi:hypothetical protein NMY22_g19923 [Coprinellus aureogranulatus]|nr:hypothetical protein NMY22_g19923 [Coprinellus aureogranulatus]
MSNCWRNLPLDEKKVWEQKAKVAKAEHKIAYPHYRFRPVHNKSKKKLAEAAGVGSGASNQGGKKAGKGGQPDLVEEMKCEEVTQLLLQGLKGEELTAALKELEKRRNFSGAPTSTSSPDAPSHGYSQHDQLEYAQQQQQQQLQHDGVYVHQQQQDGYYDAQDPYALHLDGNAYGLQQDLAYARGGMYADYSRGATPSTSTTTSQPYTAMSAPQPTYPSSSLFGLGGQTMGQGGIGGGGGGMYMQRRPSSVPAIPTSFGMGWGDYVMGDDSTLAPSSSFPPSSASSATFVPSSSSQSQSQSQTQDDSGAIASPQTRSSPLPRVLGRCLTSRISATTSNTSSTG